VQVQRGFTGHHGFMARRGSPYPAHQTVGNLSPLRSRATSSSSPQFPPPPPAPPPRSSVERSLSSRCVEDRRCGSAAPVERGVTSQSNSEGVRGGLRSRSSSRKLLKEESQIVRDQEMPWSQKAKMVLEEAAVDAKHKEAPPVHVLDESAEKKEHTEPMQQTAVVLLDDEPSPEAPSLPEEQLIEEEEVLPVTGALEDVVTVRLPEPPAPGEPSIVDKAVLLYQLVDEDLERNRRADGRHPWQLCVWVPKGVSDDRRIRVIINNMELEARVPEGAKAGQAVTAELPMSFPMKPRRQRDILRQILLCRLSVVWAADVKEYEFAPDSERRAQKVRAYRWLRGRCMVPLLSPIAEGEEEFACLE